MKFTKNEKNLIYIGIIISGIIGAIFLGKIGESLIGIIGKMLGWIIGFVAAWLIGGAIIGGAIGLVKSIPLTIKEFKDGYKK